jgi:uncharacterized protein YecE (DUF72 family)
VTESDLVGKVLMGTSGWSYKEWIGPFYRKTDRSMLQAYTKVFRTVEIDSTFYRYPSKGTVMGWTRYSPEEFVYTAKLPGLITHEKSLDLSKGVEEDLKVFVELMEPLYLSGKLGCILIQLPPKFGFNPEKLEQFFEILPTQVNFAVEFRAKSWIRNETWALLEKCQVAYTIVDEPLLPPEVHITSRIAYFRWHGRGSRPWYDYRYPSNELEPWVSKVNEVAGKTKKIYGFFNNHFHGYAVENCIQIMEMLGVATPRQLETKKQVETHLNKLNQTEDSSLLTFIEPKEKAFNNLLRFFVSSERLKRAEEIKDDEVRITSETDSRVEAQVKEYHIIIDADTKTIFHDCADWQKIWATKKLCKHIAKLLLSIDRQKAARTLEGLLEKRDEWQLKS